MRIEVRLHQLDNPTPGANTRCACGQRFAAVTVEDWLDHLHDHKLADDWRPVRVTAEPTDAEIREHWRALWDQWNY